MKITIESDIGPIGSDSKIEFDPASLFTHKDSPIKALQRPKKTHIKLRDARPGCTTFVNDQIIIDADAENWTLKYTMAKDPSTEYTYRIPKENRPFIEEAIKTGCLKRDVAYDITIESDQNKLCRWIKIEER